MRDKIIKTLAEIRPRLQADGGDVELVDLDEKTGRIKISLKGACAHCPMSEMTLKLGIEKKLKEEVPEIKEVEAIS